MRKGRIIFWTISLVICAIIILEVKIEESVIPYEEREPTKVYCIDEVKEEIKKIIEDSNFGDTHRVIFTDNKDEAEFVLTDRVTSKDDGYERLAWSPLIVAFDNTTKNKEKSYIKDGYLIEAENSYTYTIDFQKVIEATLEGKWTDKIYCPKVTTREGEIFFDFLLININSGKYTKNSEELEKCTEVANKFLSSKLVLQCDSKEKLKNKTVLENEICIIFEKDIYNMSSDSYDFEISYPTDTVLYEIYYCYKGSNEKELQSIMNKVFFSDYSKLEEVIRYDMSCRFEKHTTVSTSYYRVSDGFSYVEIPLKEE